MINRRKLLSSLAISPIALIPNISDSVTENNEIKEGDELLVLREEYDINHNNPKLVTTRFKVDKIKDNKCYERFVLDYNGVTYEHYFYIDKRSILTINGKFNTDFDTSFLYDGGRWSNGY